jgi:thioredoxin 2
MSDTIGDRPPAAAAEMLVVACPTDASLNRVPRAKLDQKPKCGRCHNPLFQGKAVELNAANFDAHTLKSDVPIVIDFWAEWCGPCRMMTPNFEMAVPRLEPRVRPAIAQRYGIRGIPSMVMIRKGQEIARTSGAMPTSAIVDWVEQALRTA